ncbi:MAG: PIN domain nuclease [Alphaproteobacteria bacterium]|nr:PIN domain nuclease [Alphaproteobacteria bacterium]
MITVDSSVWIDYFNGADTRETALLDGILGREPVVIGDLVLAEVLQGFRRDSDFHGAQAALEALVFQPMVGRANALAGARNYRALRAAGVTVRKTIDVLIATFCIEGGHVLLHADRDFAAMERHLGLRTL